MTDLRWIESAITSARPQAVAALLRYFRDLDSAEEAFQEACLRALRLWPEQGPPRDPTGWLVFVGRNAGIDAVRRARRSRPLDSEPLDGVTVDPEVELAERLDESHYRDDVLRLLFVCCHPDLPVTQQVALALRIVCGLSVAQIARAFVVSETAMEQRITRAKGPIAASTLPFEAPDADGRAERFVAVSSMIYLIFNEGYSASGSGDEARASLADEAIRLARLLQRLFPSEPEVMGLTALLLLQHSRTSARFDEHGAVVLLDDQDRSLWNRPMITEGLALIDKALRHAKPGPYQVQAAIAAMHARADRPESTDWGHIDQLYATLERMMPSPVITLNRSVAVSRLRGPAEALAMIEPLEPRLAGYFYYFGAKGRYLLDLGRKAEAKVAFDRAIGLATTAADAAHIRSHLDKLAAERAT